MTLFVYKRQHDITISTTGTTNPEEAGLEQHMTCDFCNFFLKCKNFPQTNHQTCHHNSYLTALSLFISYDLIKSAFLQEAIVELPLIKKKSLAAFSSIHLFHYDT